MGNGNQAQQQQAAAEEALKPPPTLSTEERWIVRMHGQDMGPFSSQSLYPKLLVGEIEPDTLLLDQNRFTRCRLREVSEFQPYLELHNTQNPILLKEQKAQERDEAWQTTGKKRVFLSVFMVLFLAVGGFTVWRVFIYKSGDVYMSDGDHEFSFKSFSGLKAQKKMRTDWSYKFKRRRTRGGGKNQKGKPTAATFDFTKSGGGSGIPRAKINRIIRSRFRSIVGCMKKRMEVDSRFNGGVIAFSIGGATGKINNVSVENTDYSSPILVRCIRRNSRSWQFPTFPSSAVVHFPVYIKRKTRW